MFKLLTTFIITFGSLWAFSCFGQILDKTPLGMMPMQYNPSFAGQTGGPRISASFKYGFNKASYFLPSQTLNHSLISYDQFIPAIRSGIGISAGHYNYMLKYADNMSGTGLRFDKASSSGSVVTFSFAPKISLKGKYTISPSIDFSYAIDDINYTLKQQPAVDTLFPSGKRYSIQSRAGILFNTNKLYLGYSVNVVRQVVSRSYYYPISSPIKAKLESYLQAGYTFQGSSEAKFSFTPQVVIQLSKYNRETRMDYALEAFNFNFRYKQFIWGINDGGIHTVNRRESSLWAQGGIHIGWQTDKFRIVLTNSYIPDKNRDVYSYTGHLSLRYIFTTNQNEQGKAW